MSIPGNAESGAFSRPINVQQQHSIHFLSSIPIKKRRFPIIQSLSPEEKPSDLDDGSLKNKQESDFSAERPSLSDVKEKPSVSDDNDSSNKRDFNISEEASLSLPSGSEDDNLKNKQKLKDSNERQSLADVEVRADPEEKPCSAVDNGSKNKQESNIPDEGLPAGSTNAVKDRLSPGKSDVRKSSAVIVKKEQVSHEKVELQPANVGILAPKPHEANLFVALASSAELRNKMDLLPAEKHTELGALESSMNSRTVRVKQEVSSAQVEAAPRLELSMSSMNVELSLGPKESILPGSECQSSEATCSMPAKSDPTLLSLVSGKVTSGDNSNRSHWDLNTTMDVWEGSTVSNPIGRCQLASIGNFSKANVSSDIRSDLTGAGCSNKGKQIREDHISNSSNSSRLTVFQDKADDSLGLRLATPNREVIASREVASSNILECVSPQLNLGQVRQSATNVIGTVKSEPIDENSRYDCSIGSSSSSNIGLPKFSPFKRELVSSYNLDVVLPSSQRRSIKSQVAEGTQNGTNPDDDTLPQSGARVMQHQESSASSCAPPLPMLLPQNSGPSTLPTVGEFSASGDLPNHSENSDHSNEIHSDKDKSDEQVAGMESTKHVSQDDKHTKVSNVDNSADKCKWPRVDGCTDELSLPANDEEKINIPAEIVEDYFGSDSESQEMDIDEEDVSNKEDEEFEDGEVREPGQSSMVKGLIGGTKSGMSELVQHNPLNLQCCGLGNENISASEFEVTIPDKTIQVGDMNKDCPSISYEPNNVDYTSKNLSDQVIGGGDYGKGSVSVASDKQERSSGKEVSCGSLVEVSHGKGVTVGVEATKTVFKGINSEENDSTVSKEELSLNDNDDTKESNTTGSKSRIINLPRSVVTTPGKSKSIPPNRLQTSRSGKERYSDVDGEIQPRGNRDEFYLGGSNKFARERIHDQSLRNPRQGFMRGKGRTSGRFGSFRREWDGDHDFESEGYRGQSDYRPIRRKHTSISNVDLECNNYGVPQDGGSRRKEINEEFSALRRTSIRRLSAGDRDGSENRGIPMLRRIPRNMSPSQCIEDECSDLPGPRHGNKFMQHLSEDIMDPVFDHQQAMYDELDGHFARGNRNFSTLHRNGYPRIGSKSPIQSRTRSPGLWGSPRRRSPNGPPEMLYRTGRMRSPERPCFRDEMITRRRPSPSYVTRHLNDSRDVVSGRDHGHFKSPNGNRRSSPGRAFPRHARRADALNPQEMGGDGNEYMTGPLHSNKFHGDGSIDDRRNFTERHGQHRPFRPNYNGDMDNFPFLQNEDGPRPYRFCPEMDTEFVERRNMREREFDGHIKHPPRRTRNIEEQQDGNYRSMERVWHEEEFSDTRMKRIRF